MLIARPSGLDEYIQPSQQSDFMDTRICNTLPNMMHELGASRLARDIVRYVLQSQGLLRTRCVGGADTEYYR